MIFLRNTLPQESDGCGRRAEAEVGHTNNSKIRFVQGQGRGTDGSFYWFSLGLSLLVNTTDIKYHKQKAGSLPLEHGLTLQWLKVGALKNSWTTAFGKGQDVQRPCASYCQPSLRPLENQGTERKGNPKVCPVKGGKQKGKEKHVYSISPIS